MQIEATEKRRRKFKDRTFHIIPWASECRARTRDIPASSWSRQSISKKNSRMPHNGCKMNAVSMRQYWQYDATGFLIFFNFFSTSCFFLFQMFFNLFSISPQLWLWFQHSNFVTCKEHCLQLISNKIMCIPCCICVSTSEVVVVERLGKFDRFIQPGLGIIFCPCEQQAGTVSVRKISRGLIFFAHTSMH